MKAQLSLKRRELSLSFLIAISLAVASSDCFAQTSAYIEDLDEDSVVVPSASQAIPTSSNSQSNQAKTPGKPPPIDGVVEATSATSATSQSSPSATQEKPKATKEATIDFINRRAPQAVVEDEIVKIDGRTLGTYSEVGISVTGTVMKVQWIVKHPVTSSFFPNGVPESFEVDLREIAHVSGNEEVAYKAISEERLMIVFMKCAKESRCFVSTRFDFVSTRFDDVTRGHLGVFPPMEVELGRRVLEAIKHLVDLHSATAEPF